MIHFVGNVQSNFARGKDKTKRKSRVNPLVGAGLGTALGGPGGTIAGALIAKGVNKERDRFDKEGARTHLGKVGHDASLGAKSLGIGSAAMGGLIGGSIGSHLPVRKKGFLGIGRDKKQEARDKLKNTLMGAGLGVLGGGVSGAINGAGTGALVGAGRGFVQENRMGKKKKGNFNEYIDAADFAFTLAQTQRNDKKAIKRNAKLGGRVGALAGAAYSLKNSKSIKNAALMGAAGALGGSILSAGATGVHRLLKRKTIKVGKKSIINYSNSSDMADFAFSLPLLQPKQKKSRVGLKTGLAYGALTGGIKGAALQGTVGALADRQINKEKARFRKEGARSRLGKIGNDARIGAVASGAVSAGLGALHGARIPGSIGQRAVGAAISGIGGGVGGAIGGGLTGSGVGLVRGFRQPNKKKK